MSDSVKARNGDVAECCFDWQTHHILCWKFGGCEVCWLTVHLAMWSVIWLIWKSVLWLGRPYHRLAYWTGWSAPTHIWCGRITHINRYYLSKHTWANNNHPIPADRADHQTTCVSVCVCGWGTGDRPWLAMLWIPNHPLYVSSSHTSTAGGFRVVRFGCWLMQVFSA